MLRPDEATKEFHDVVYDWDLRGACHDKVLCPSMFPGDDEPMMLREAEVTFRSQIKMGSSSPSNFLSRLDTSIGTKEVVVLLFFKVLKIKFKDPRNLH